MRYKVNLNSREYEIIAEGFSFDKYYQGIYDSKTKLGLTREAWQDNIPLYLHDVGEFNAEYLIKKSQTIVTTEPIFSVFDLKNLTFVEMIKEIGKRSSELLK